MQVKAKLSYICDGTVCVAFVTFHVPSAADVEEHLEILCGDAIRREDVIVEWATSKQEEER